MSEEVLWKGSPSQLLNLWKFVAGLILAAGFGVGGSLVMPLLWIGTGLALLWMLWEYLRVRCRVYELSAERLRLYEGVLNQKIDEMELYRVKDTTMERPFWQRIFGLSTLHLETSDRSHPMVSIEAVRDGVHLREVLRKQVEYWRDRKRVREVDFEDGDDEMGLLE